VPTAAAESPYLFFSRVVILFILSYPRSSVLSDRILSYTFSQNEHGEEKIILIEINQT
jgi:hypothetical protein